ncbi:MAG: hypothetical protein QOJ27_1205 [Sphingomonadales bacterium]|nr:hypothetical protein [Sphingomonadales bacterium]
MCRGRAGRDRPRVGRESLRPNDRAAPKTKWRPALLPASTVPRSVRLARKRSSLSQGGSGRGLAAPVGPSGSFAGISLFRFRFLRVPLLALRPDFGSLAGSSLLRLAASKVVSLSVVREASFQVVLSRFLPPGGFRFRRTLEGKWVRHWLAPPPRASSFRLPGTSFRSASVRRHPPLSAGPSLRASLRFRKAAPCDKPVSASLRRFAQALFQRFGLWITGITGITQVKPARAPPPSAQRPARGRSAR